MVFTYYPNRKDGSVLGLVAPRHSAESANLLIVEGIAGLIVALLVILIIALGWRKLMKNHFYLVLSNLIVGTSMKGFVELAFILPYYVLQRNDLLVNRDIQKEKITISFRSTTVLCCVFVWFSAAIIPLLFFFLQCKYAYSDTLRVYTNKCLNGEGALSILLKCLVYLSYSCAAAVLVVYCNIFALLHLHRKRNRNFSSSDRTSTQMKLLRQSVVVFVLYAASIMSVFGISFLAPNDGFSVFELVYAENLLNLSIAAVYPICFLTMSGEMRNVLLSRVVPRSSYRITTVGAAPPLP